MRDVFFIFLVIVAGGMAVMFTNRSSDEVIVNKSRISNETDRAAAPGQYTEEDFEINYSRIIQGTSGTYDTAEQLKEELKALDKTDELERLERKKLATEIESEDPEVQTVSADEIKSTFSWRTLYDRWNIVLLDSTGHGSNILFTVSNNDCEITFEDDNNNAYTYPGFGDTQVSYGDDTMTLKGQGGKPYLTITGVQNLDALVEATNKLTTYCAL